MKADKKASLNALVEAEMASVMKAQIKVAARKRCDEILDRLGNECSASVLRKIRPEFEKVLLEALRAKLPSFAERTSRDLTL